MARSSLQEEENQNEKNLVYAINRYSAGGFIVAALANGITPRELVHAK